MAILTPTVVDIVKRVVGMGVEEQEEGTAVAVAVGALGEAVVAVWADKHQGERLIQEQLAFLTKTTASIELDLPTLLRLWVPQGGM